MEDTNKLFVFEKKEVLLIFLFVALIASFAFVLGVQVGKNLSRSSQVEMVVPQTPADMIDLKSQVEEEADQISIETTPQEKTEISEDELKLQELDRQFKAAAESEAGPVSDDMPKEKPSTTSMDDTQESRELAGKFTIQLASKNSREAAVEFAEPFRAAGYDVLINAAQIPGEGTWFRVSIGLFNTREAAKEYMDSEVDLFQGKDYFIQQFR